jgi:hypothetical protein
MPNEDLRERIELLEETIELEKQVTGKFTNEDLVERIRLLEELIELESETP